MRRITTGVQGGPVLGTFTAMVNNLSTIETNVDMVLDPNGTGEVKSAKHIQLNAEKTLKLPNLKPKQNAVCRPSKTTPITTCWF